jgi:hypothetical protein
MRSACSRLVLAVAVSLLGACSEPTYVARPLPPLVAPTPAAEVGEIQATALGFTAGERFVWDVHVRGMTIGRLELAVRSDTIKSRFATGTLASAIATVEHDLTTVIDGGRPVSSRERFDLDGKIRHFATQFTGTRSHSIHTALGAIRAWAVRGAPAGFLHVVVGDKLVRLELQPPAELQGVLEVDGRIVGLDDPVALTITLDASHVITRIEARSAGEQITLVPSF